jgi:hypothetical protein
MPHRDLYPRCTRRLVPRQPVTARGHVTGCGRLSRRSATQYHGHIAGVGDYFPSAGLETVLVIVVALMLLGRI